ncbi:MAG: glycogen synthase GlgA [Clostridiales bacterium]|nr:glycogen synthase GlgA [Clostridiales bacterium]MBQ2816433.1 glycogen synthase GlgA [Clostridia bacterium]
MKILFAASECAPFVKTGGLADVMGALPKALAARGEEVCVILPLYKDFAQAYREKLTHEMYFYINLGWRRQYCGIETLVENGVKYIFLDNEYYYARPSVYGYGGDECERFAFFCRAVLEAIPHIDFIPDIIHCNDWQTGLIPVLLRTQYQWLDLYKDIKTVYTVHNLQYQGVFDINYVEDMLGLGSWMYTADKLEFYGGCSFMKGALVYADKLTTVSPEYAKEITTPYYGERLDGVIRARGKDMSGIINGIDTGVYDPHEDPAIEQKYCLKSFHLKAKNKAALQKEMGLDINPDVPVIGMVTRLSGQKGFDLVEYALNNIMNLGVQMVVLGTGEERYANLLRWASWRYKGQFSAKIEMNLGLADRIYAGADMYLMPSKFEPCGLSQLIAMRYGTVPIVRETGGLKDTVQPYNEVEGTGTGFTFYSYNADDMLDAIRRATKTYNDDPAAFKGIAKRGMAGNYGWDASAEKYLAIYNELVK